MATFLKALGIFSVIFFVLENIVEFFEWTRNLKIFAKSYMSCKILDKIFNRD